MKAKKFGIGILGLGNVGEGTLNIIRQNQDWINREIAPHQINIAGLAEKDPQKKPESTDIDFVFSTDAQEIIDHPDIHIIIEAIGGEYPAYALIKRALKNGKHVITPNKEVVAKHGYELIDLAYQHRVQFLFETSVASAVPILGILTNRLTSCPLNEMVGVLNGTTNFILDLMLEKNMAQQEALKKAQELGYAEADPTKDIAGYDALYKIFILSSLGFRSKIDLRQICFSGITDIGYEDIQLAQRFGYRIKLLAIARKKEALFDIRVHPALVDINSSLAQVRGVDNGILVNGDCFGELYFSGAGAGGIAGGSMIVSDIIRTIRKPNYFEFSYLREDKQTEVRSFYQDKTAYLMRISHPVNADRSEAIREIFTQKRMVIKKISEITTQDNQMITGIITDVKKKKRIKEMMHYFDALEDLGQVCNCIPVFQKNNHEREQVKS